MKAQLITYRLDKIADIKDIEIPDNYDGDPYGDTIPFVVHSNQQIVTCD